MLVLGVDPGTAITGYGLVQEEQGDLALVTYGTVTTPATQPLAQRLRTIYHELRNLIACYRPDAMAVEELFFARNAKTAMIVGHARGVVLLAGVEAERPLFEYTPLQVKQAVAGYGSADKHQVQEMVRLLLNLDHRPQPDDAADALAVAICHLHSARAAALLEQAP